MKENSNKGFSLLELVVIMAIMAIVLTLTTTGFGMIGKSKIKSATKTIESRIDEARQTNMARDGEWWTEITLSDDKYYIAVKYRQKVINDIGIEVTEEKLDSYEELGNALKIFYKDADGAEQNIADNGLYIRFNKKDGSVSSIVDKNGNSYISSTSKNGKIIVKNNKDQKYEMTLYYKTGQINSN